MGMRTYMDIINEAMSRSDALAIFSRHGVAADGMDPAALKLAHRTLAKKLHGDVGGSGDDMALVNAAYDELKKPASYGGAHGYSEYRPGASARDERRTSRQPDEDGDYPVWAQAGHSGGMREGGRIVRHDYTDDNFIKKRMWRLSGRQTSETWTIWNFDGTTFRQAITVYGTSAIFAEMARAMCENDPYYDCRAVFVSNRNTAKRDRLLLIWSDGEDRVPPIVMEHESSNLNPGNDRQFTRRLPEVLDRIRDGAGVA